MAARQPRFSPKQIAKALEVSESSVKRWCDEGAIPAMRTMGGHRKITLDALQRFIDDSGRELRLPQALGLPKLSPLRATKVPGTDHPTQKTFRECLALGDENGCRSALRARIDEGATLGEAAEELVTDAMRGFGEAWENRQIDPYQERRGCDICIRLINELRRELPDLRDDAPYAFGGAPEGDPYQLPTALVELGLREIGWNAVSLGCNLPLQSFLQAAHDRQPQLVWLSISTIDQPSDFVLRQRRLADALGENIPLLIGGRALTDDIRPKLAYTAHCDSVGHMVELAAMLRWDG